MADPVNDEGLQLLTNDCQQLTETMQATLAPLANMNTFQLSQNHTLREDAVATVATMNRLLNAVQDMIDEADAIKNIRKTVHFQKKGGKPRIQPYKDGVAIVSDDGHVSYADILHCDFLFIADHAAVYDPLNVTVCDDVHIVLTEEVLSRPLKLRFHSGGNYYIYYDWSFTCCYNLYQTGVLTLA